MTGAAAAGPLLGRPAPLFALDDQHGRSVGLAELRGRPVLLVFFPFVFTPTCAGELTELRELASVVGPGSARVYGVSCDPTSAQRAFADQIDLGFPLLSDFWPHGEVSRAYGVFVESRGFATRGSFLVDAAGMLRWSVVNPPGQPRDLTEHRDALVALSG